MTNTIISEALTDDDALAELERTHRPAWATSEGAYDDEQIYYKRWMTHGTVWIDQFLNRHPLEWLFDHPAEINVRIGRRPGASRRHRDQSTLGNGRARSAPVDAV